MRKGSILRDYSKSVKFSQKDKKNYYELSMIGILKFHSKELWLKSKHIL